MNNFVKSVLIVVLVLSSVCVAQSDKTTPLGKAKIAAIDKSSIILEKAVKANVNDTENGNLLFFQELLEITLEEIATQEFAYTVHEVDIIHKMTMQKMVRVINMKLRELGNRNASTSTELM